MYGLEDNPWGIDQQWIRDMSQSIPWVGGFLDPMFDQIDVWTAEAPYEYDTSYDASLGLDNSLVQVEDTYQGTGY